MTRSAETDPALAEVAARSLDALRARKPLVQAITNAVSSNFVANVLLAAGAAPAMVDNPEEAALFATIADATLCNLGTPTTAQVTSMGLATEAAFKAGKPWVLDPVGAGGLPWRGGVAARLLNNRPTLVRGNASEIIGLAGLGGGARGVDSSADPTDAVGPAVDLLAHAAAVSASGAVDHLVGTLDGRAVLVRISGGSALMPRVTATGCGLGALAAAYAAVSEMPLIALVAAHVHYKVAAEHAAAEARGPGSFAVAFLDALAAVDADNLRAEAKIASRPL